MHAWHFAFCTMLQEPNLFNLCCIPIEFVEKESEENIRLLAIWPSLMELLFIFNWICWKFRDFKVWMQMNLPWKRNYQKQSHFILDFSQLLICYLQINPLCQIPFEASKISFSGNVFIGNNNWLGTHFGNMVLLEDKPQWY